MGILTRKQPARPAPTIRRPTSERSCTAQKRHGGSCSNWAVKGGSTCFAHTPSNRPVGEQSNTKGSMVAASTNLKFSGVSWKEWRVGNRAWQEEAWRLYDITGQLRFVARSVANSMSLCNLYVTELDEAGNEIGETEDEQINALAAKPLGTGPAKAEAVQAMGLQLFVSGETFLVSEARPDREGGDHWYVVSGAEIRKVGNEVVITRPPQCGGGDLVITDQHLLIRIWTPHPREQCEPDSPVRAAIPDLLELESIRKRKFSELDSRLTGGGVWFLPDSIDFPHGDDRPDGAEGFSQELSEAMSMSMQDRANARAFSPLIATVNDDVLDKIRDPFTFWSEMSSELTNMQDSALRSLAQDLDAPVSMMLGSEDTNHWSAWLIEETTIKTHYEPPLNRIADALTREYLYPALEYLGYEDVKRYAFRFSTAPLRVRADRTADAMELYKLGLLSDAALLEAAAFTEEDIPDDEEKAKRLARDIMESQPSVGLLDPEIRRLAGFEDDVAEQAPIQVQSEVAPQQEEIEPPEQRALPEQADAPPEEQPDGLTAACEVSVLRALELAGGRLVPHRERGDTPKHRLHTLISAGDRPTADKALHDAWNHLHVIASAYSLNSGELETLLHGYVTELITRGIEHNPAALSALVRVARNGR